VLTCPKINEMKSTKLILSKRLNRWKKRPDMIWSRSFSLLTIVTLPETAVVGELRRAGSRNAVM